MQKLDQSLNEFLNSTDGQIQIVLIEGISTPDVVDVVKKASATVINAFQAFPIVVAEVTPDQLKVILQSEAVTVVRPNRTHKVPKFS